MIRDILQFPMPDVDANNSNINDLDKLVNIMLSLNQQKQTTTNSETLEQLDQRIAYTDDKINRLVYELYGLSKEEVGIVEVR